MGKYDEGQRELDRVINRFNIWYGLFWIAVATTIAWFTSSDIDTFYDCIRYAALAGIFVYAVMEYFDRKFKRIEDILKSR